jgi:hypothetical protein
MRPGFGRLVCFREEFGLDPTRGKMSKATVREDFQGRHLSSALSSIHKGAMRCTPTGISKVLKEAEGLEMDYRGIHLLC